MSKWRAGERRLFYFYKFDEVTVWGAPRGDCQTKTSCLSQLHAAILDSDWGEQVQHCPLRIISTLVACRQRSNSKTQKTWFLWIVLVASLFRFLSVLDSLSCLPCIWNGQKVKSDTGHFEIHANVTLSICPSIILDYFWWEIWKLYRTDG